MAKTKHKNKPNKRPWPTKDVMEQIYEKNLWGQGEFSGFYSGFGSHNPDIVKPYTDALVSFLSAFKRPLSVCDLGCGDFNVGKTLVEYTRRYVAVDIVEDLIMQNKKKFLETQLEFYCMDISVDKLPSGDCVLLRQVLQHLSNAEVQCILNKLSVFKYVIITEHLPEHDFEPNKDIISGQGIRLKKQSGLNVLATPFNFKVMEEQELTSVVLPNFKGAIVTTLYKLF